MNRIIKFLFVPCFIFSITSCNKSNIIHSVDLGSTQNLGMPTVLSYIKAMTKRVDASFGISIENSMNLPTSKTDPVSFYGYCLSSNNKPVDVGPINVGDFTIPAASSQNNMYDGHKILDQSVFGKNISFVLKGKSPSTAAANGIITNGVGDATSSFNFSDSLYIPQQLVIKNIGINPLGGTNFIAPQKVFNWEPDPNNTQNGVIVILEYDPNTYGNESMKSAFPKDIHNGFVVADSGEYALDKSLFTDMPHNANLTLYMVRGNYKVGQTLTGKDYLLYSYTAKNFVYGYK